MCLIAGAIVSVPPLLVAGKLSLMPKIYRWNWHGSAMGAKISIQICHKSQQHTEAIIKLCIDEISRLESIFTLYSDNSELVRLNKNSSLQYPAPELVELMSLAYKYGDITNGAFDITIQPIWNIIKQDGINSSKIKETLPLVNYKQINISPKEISFAKPNMAVSLNGIAQGYITDKIAALLKSQNINNALVNIGEIRAIGGNEDNKPWKIGLHDPRGNSNSDYFTEVMLRERSLSTTGGYGFALSADGKTHHIFNPKSGKSANNYLSLSVIADTATKADALSTAFYIMQIEQIEKILAKLTDVRVIIMHNDGQEQIL